MSFIVGFVLGAVCGFIGGFLFYRNNSKKLQDGEQILRKEN